MRLAEGITDPVGDHTGAVDATGLLLDIINDGGDYRITVSADAANPFLGEFRININLFNATLDEYFQDVFNDFDEASPLTEITLTGNDPELTDWSDTHTIATSTFDGEGNPDNVTLFRTSVADLPFAPICVAEDIIGLDGCGAAAIAEPPALALVGLRTAPPGEGDRLTGARGAGARSRAPATRPISCPGNRSA